jgi:hypothetical protein
LEGEKSILHLGALGGLCGKKLGGKSLGLRGVARASYFVVHLSLIYSCEFSYVDRLPLMFGTAQARVGGFL